MDHDRTTLEKWSLFVAGEVQAAQIQPTEDRSHGGPNRCPHANLP